MNDEREFVFPAIDVKEIVDAGDHDEMVQVSAPVCDFCFDLRVRWEYPCEPFVIEELEWGSADEWLACERCASFIDRSLFGDLMARHQISLYLRGLEQEHDELRAQGLILEAFLAHRLDEKRPFG